LYRLRRLTDLRHDAFECAVWKCLHRERRLFPTRTPPTSLSLSWCRSPSWKDPWRSGTRWGSGSWPHGLAHRDVAGNHDPIDRGSDAGISEIDLSGIQLRTFLRNGGLIHSDLGARLIQRIDHNIIAVLGGCVGRDQVGVPRLGNLRIARLAWSFAAGPWPLPPLPGPVRPPPDRARIDLCA